MSEIKNAEIKAVLLQKIVSQLVKEHALYLACKIWLQLIVFFSQIRCYFPITQLYGQV